MSEVDPSVEKILELAYLRILVDKGDLTLIQAVDRVYDDLATVEEIVYPEEDGEEEGEGTGED